MTKTERKSMDQGILDRGLASWKYSTFIHKTEHKKSRPKPAFLFYYRLLNRLIINFYLLEFRDQRVHDEPGNQVS